MSERKHTPGELKVIWKRCAYHVATNDIVVASCYPNDYQYNYVVRPKNEDECIANADFIVRACNAHYDLIEALEEAVFNVAKHGEANLSPAPKMWLGKARAAIAKAKENEQ